MYRELLTHPKLRRFMKGSGLSRNEAAGTLFSVWAWAVDNSDRSGLILEADKRDIADVISSGSGLSRGVKPSQVVDSMIEAGWIDEIDGHLYLHDWDEWQDMYYRFIDKRERDTARKRRAREAERAAASTLDSQLQLPEPAPPPAEEPQKDTEEKKSRYTPAFEQFWSAYPRKVEKGNAYKKYRARLNDGYSEDDLLKAARAYALECKQQRTEDKYIKHAKTFLSDSLPFLDYLHKREPPTQAASGKGAELIPEEWRNYRRGESI